MSAEEWRNVNPNPQYPKISLSDVSPASGLIFYGGPKITEKFGNEVYGYPYKPAPFHAGVYLGNNIFCNVGLFTTLENLNDEFRSSRRIDVIYYTNMTFEQREKVCSYEQKRAGSASSRFRFYDWKGFLYAGTRLIPGINRLIKPSKKYDFCSDNYVDAFSHANVPTSLKEDEETYPWDLLFYAWQKPQETKIYTLWVGKDFK